MKLLPNSLQSSLERYIQADSSCAADCHEKLAREVEKVVNAHVRKLCPLSISEDLDRDCIYIILSHVSKLKKSGECHIGHFLSYIRTVVRNRLCDEIRKNNPGWRHVANAVDHLVAGRMNATGIAVWECPVSTQKIVGYEKWSGQQAGRMMASLDRHGAADAFCRNYLSGVDPCKAEITVLVDGILRCNGGPVAMADLIRLICVLRRIAPLKFVSLDEPKDEEQSNFELPDPRSNTEQQAVQSIVSAEILQSCWGSLQRLNRNQLVVICLQFDTEMLVPLALVAGGLDSVAAAMQISVEELKELISLLPLNDRVIGELIGVSADKVPGIRNKARQRMLRVLQRNPEIEELFRQGSGDGVVCYR